MQNASKWDRILSILPQNMEALAYSTGAFVRPRGIPSPSVLLRLLLAYSTTSFSFRQIAAWATMQEIAQISDVALILRMKHCETWLNALINELLPSMPHVAVSRPIHLIDATAVRTMDQSIWRIHAVYDATQSQLKQVLLTDERQGETLKHFTPEAGVLYIGDRAYQGKDGVRQFLDAGADLLIRVKIRPYLAHKNPDHLVELPTKGGRVIIAPIPKEKWEAIDSRQQRQQQRKQRKRSKQPAESHYYLTLFCSDATLSGEEAVALYRWRWQIELIFKQLKSIQGLDETQLKSPALLRVYFLCQILVRLLSERLFTKGLFPPEVGISYVCLASISDDIRSVKASGV